MKFDEGPMIMDFEIVGVWNLIPKGV